MKGWCNGLRTIIGGLLVVSLLSRPSVMNFALWAYDALNKDNKIICVLKSDDDNFDPQTAREIDGMLVSIEENTRDITGLLKEKNKVLGKLETTLDLKRYAKEFLDDNQMDQYARFMSYVDVEKQELRKSLQKIDDAKYLSDAKNELLHTDVDYEFVYNELQTINKYQNEAINTLNGMIAQGTDVLNLL